MFKVEFQQRRDTGKCEAANIAKWEFSSPKFCPMLKYFSATAKMPLLELPISQWVNNWKEPGWRGKRIHC